MSTEPLYRMINGEPMLSHRAVALLIDMPADVVKAEWDRQGAATVGAMTFPKGWVKRGVRVRKEVSAALGREPSMKESIDYLAAKADR